MNNLKFKLKPIALASVLVAQSIIAGSVLAAEVAAAPDQTSKLLTTHFEARNVVKIEAGDFHFIPGQVAPVHTHAAPAIGYVAKGSIIYQVEGEKQQILNEGDAFYEPVGPRILRFDNASATEEAIFIDFNLQQEGEPFIVFDQPPTENIDRRTLPTTELKTRAVSKVETFITELEPKAKRSLTASTPILGYVAEGIIFVKEKNGAKKRLVAGQTFSLTGNNIKAVMTNSSAEVPAKIVTFYIR